MKNFFKTLFSSSQSRPVNEPIILTGRNTYAKNHTEIMEDNSSQSNGRLGTIERMK